MSGLTKMDGRTVITWTLYLASIWLGWYLFEWVGLPLGFIIAFIIDRSFTNLMERSIIDALINAKDDEDD